jgi:sulfate permease, SulP family
MTMEEGVRARKGTGPSGAPPAGFVDLFTPKLVTILREGHGLAQLRAVYAQGIMPPLVSYERSIEVAMSKSRKHLAAGG